MSRVQRFGLCLAIAFLVMLALPSGGPRDSAVQYDERSFFAMAGQIAVVLLLATALYAATLFVEYVWTRRKPPSGW